MHGKALTVLAFDPSFAMAIHPAACRSLLIVLLALALPALALTASGQGPAHTPVDTVPADPAQRQAGNVFSVLLLDMDGGISPATADLLDAALDNCRTHEHDMLLIRLDTPGGLGESMRRMVKSILASPVPVGVWVGPSGARAASAGVFLVAASSVAGMSPGSTIGAASPVAMGGKEMDETMAAKVKNDILSLVTGIAAARGRNVDWYAKAVEEAVSITATQAVDTQVVEFLADSPADFLAHVADMSLEHGGRTVTLDPARVDMVRHVPGWRHLVLSWLLEPQVAYMLLLGGMAGLFFELTTPGAIFPGVFGGICLLLGLYAMAVLPTNIAGLLLILFGLVLFILEIKITSFGMLTLAGLVSLFIGSTILFKFEYGMTGLPMSTILVTVGGLGCIVGLGIYLVTRAYLRRPRLGASALVGLSAEVRSWSGASGTVFVHGEIWNAVSRDSQPLDPGDQVAIISIQGLQLTVAPQAPPRAKHTAQKQ